VLFTDALQSDIFTLFGVVVAFMTVIPESAASPTTLRLSIQMDVQR
jgi:hypothetical protein